MKFFALLCLVIAVDGVLSAGVLKRDVAAKTKDDEDVYGDLDTNNGQVQKDQVDYYDEDKDEEDGPVEAPPAETGRSSDADVKLISTSETILEELGHVVRMPCEVSSKVEAVRVWSKDLKPIIQDMINIGNKKNYKMLSNGTLEVILEDAEDFGTYSCKLLISDTTQPEVVHMVVQKESPNITALLANDNKQVFDIGESLTLTCQASGYPKPRISWHKNGERLGTEGESLTINNVKAKHAGEYLCLADNDVGKPAHKNIEVFINHSPIVSIEKYIVNSAHESDAELVCEVKAYPVPTVNWQRNGENVVSNEPKIKLERHHKNEKNILIIKNISESDFGQYSCVAKNSLGKQVKNINLVKTPTVPGKFAKQPSKDNVKDVILEWKVESKQPISMHELQYRRKGENSWKTITPDVGISDNDVYRIQHTLTNLEPVVYETRARSKNSHGWSNYSEIIPFEGDSSHDMPAQHRSEEALPVGESTSSSSSLSSSIALVILALLTVHNRQ